MLRFTLVLLVLFSSSLLLVSSQIIGNYGPALVRVDGTGITQLGVSASRVTSSGNLVFIEDDDKVYRENLTLSYPNRKLVITINDFDILGIAASAPPTKNLYIFTDAEHDSIFRYNNDGTGVPALIQSNINLTPKKMVLDSGFIYFNTGSYGNRYLYRVSVTVANPPVVKLIDKDNISVDDFYVQAGVVTVLEDGKRLYRGSNFGSLTLLTSTLSLSDSYSIAPGVGSTTTLVAGNSTGLYSLVAPLYKPTLLTAKAIKPIFTLPGATPALPKAPPLLLQSATATSLGFSFNTVSGATTYEFNYKKQSASTWIVKNNVVSPLSIPGLVASTKYTVRLRAKNTAGAGAWTDATFSTL